MAELLKQDEQEDLVIEESNITDEPVEKEYEKLLFKDESRLKAVKAFKLVKMGLFYQKTFEPNEINFNILKKLDFAKQFKNHELYERVTDGTFFFIETLGEETKDGVNKVYGYDVIELDNVDDATYKKLIDAHKHEGNALINVSFGAAITFVILSLASLISTLLYNIIDAKVPFTQALFIGTSTSFGLIAIAFSSLVVASIIKKKYDEQ